MKFGKQLLLHIIPEWSDKYLSYKVLKKLLSRLKKKIRAQGSVYPMVYLLNIAEKSVFHSMSMQMWEQGSLRTNSDLPRNDSSKEGLNELLKEVETTERASQRNARNPYQVETNMSEEKKQFHSFMSTVQIKRDTFKDRVDSSKENLVDFQTDINFWVEEYRTNIEKINAFYLKMMEELQERYDFMMEGLARIKIEFQGEELELTQDFIQISKITENLKEKSSEEMQKSSQTVSLHVKEQSISYNKAISKPRRHGAQKDSLEYATSWTRAFYDIYEKSLWLKSYCRINEMATTKILKKFKKAIFKRQSNQLTDFLHERTQDQRFVAHLELSIFRHKLIESYAFEFTNGNKAKAKADLERNPVVTLRKKDSLPIVFFLGLSLGFLILLIVIFYTPLQSSHFKVEQVYPSLPAYRYSLIIILTFLSCGVLIAIYRYFRVNYILIFGLDLQTRIREAQLFKMFTVLLCVWLFCGLGQICMLKLDLFAGSNMSLFSFFLFILLLILWVNPFRCCYRSIRFELLRTLAHIVIAPFGKVEFRHFFMADILTSLVKPLVDIRYCFCYFILTSCWLRDADNGCFSSENRSLQITDLIITMLPYWFRFAQCLNKFHYTRLTPHLINAGKYFFSLMIPVTSYLYHKSHHKQNLQILFLSVSVVGALYAYSWDLYMDWGLLRTTKPGRRFLRDKILYPAWIYYIAAFLDLLLRFAWVLSLLPMLIFAEFWGAYFQVFLADILEWFRRSMWATFRVENQNINNFERYRAVPEIPKLQLQQSTHLRRQLSELKNSQFSHWPNVRVNSYMSLEQDER